MIRANRPDSDIGMVSLCKDRFRHENLACLNQREGTAGVPVRTEFKDVRRELEAPCSADMDTICLVTKTWRSLISILFCVIPVMLGLAGKVNGPLLRIS